MPQSERWDPSLIVIVAAAVCGLAILAAALGSGAMSPEGPAAHAAGKSVSRRCGPASSPGLPNLAGPGTPMERVGCPTARRTFLDPRIRAVGRRSSRRTGPTRGARPPGRRPPPRWRRATPLRDPGPTLVHQTPRPLHPRANRPPERVEHRPVNRSGSKEVLSGGVTGARGRSAPLIRQRNRRRRGASETTRGVNSTPIPSSRSGSRRSGRFVLNESRERIQKDVVEISGEPGEADAMAGRSIHRPARALGAVHHLRHADPLRLLQRRRPGRGEPAPRA